MNQLKICLLFCLITPLVLITDSDESMQKALLEAEEEFNKEIKEYLLKGEYNSSSRINKEVFTKIFYDILTQNQTISDDEKPYLDKVLQNILNKTSEQIPINDITTLLNITQISLLYSDIIQDITLKDGL